MVQKPMQPVLVDSISQNVDHHHSRHCFCNKRVSHHSAKTDGWPTESISFDKFLYKPRRDDVQPIYSMKSFMSSHSMYVFPISFRDQNEVLAVFAGVPEFEYTKPLLQSEYTGLQWISHLRSQAQVPSSGRETAAIQVPWGKHAPK